MAAILPSSPERQYSFSSDSLPIDRYFLDSPDMTESKSPVHNYPSRDCPSPVNSSAPSSIPSSPDFNPTSIDNAPPSPATLSTVSLSTNYTEDSDDEEILLPAYEGYPVPKKVSDIPNEVSELPRVRASGSAADDSSIEEEPSRHVDYLSHEWEEGDIWASWRYVVARRNVYDNGARLENASWRTWAKIHLKRGTVSPEALNWLKDCDVTWLYGPLKTCGRRKSASNPSLSSSHLTTPTLCQDRKPILKKRTASETILQRSLSQHTLLQHAGAILKAQEAEQTRTRSSFRALELDRMLPRPADGRQAVSPNGTPINTMSSGGASPNERRHIHFNNEVVQCIAVESEDGDDDEEVGGDWPTAWDDDSLLDRDFVTMKQMFSTPSDRSASASNAGGENRTIAPLPSTILKYRGDTPEPPAGSFMHRWSGYLSASVSSSAVSSSAETTRQSFPSANFLLDDGDYDPDYFHHPDPHAFDSGDRPRPWFVNRKDDEELDRDMDFASSGLLWSDDERDSSNGGILDRVVDTVNTARDIAHVIWNVGWRR